MARFYYDQDMELDPALRFSSRVEAYARFRPSYPREVLDLLERQCGLTAASKIADVGCGVTAVEPNPDMRAAAERALSRESGYHSVDGRAEATTLPDASVDFVTA